MGPSWSPDGNSIVFTSGGVIHFVSLDGLQPRVLQLPSSIGSPRMSRTGALVFHSTADGNTRFRSDAGLVPRWRANRFWLPARWFPLDLRHEE